MNNVTLHDQAGVLIARLQEPIQVKDEMVGLQLQILENQVVHSH
jgi:hypothetical protein